MFVIRWGQMQFPNDLLERRRAAVPGAVHIRLAPIRVPAFLGHSIPRGAPLAVEDVVEMTGDCTTKRH